MIPALTTVIGSGRHQQVVMHSLTFEYLILGYSNKFDADCQYIYRWIPELKAYAPKILHQWHKKHQPGSYPAPIIDHAVESHSTKARFKSALNG